jgi:hypothetical protein
MKLFERALRGVEAGAIAAAGMALSFFILDLVRLEPLATVGTLSGALPGPGATTLDLTNLSGVVAAVSTGLRIAAFGFGHFLAFMLAGVLASVLFDWRRLGGVGRFAVLAALCIGAFYASVAWSNSVVAVESVGVPLVVGVNLFAAALLGFGLHVAALPEPPEGPLD